MKEKCECCNVRKPIGVVSSALGPASFATCHECWKAGAEPRSFIEYTVWMAHGWDGVDVWVKENVKFAADGEYFRAEWVQLSAEEMRLRDMAYASYCEANEQIPSVRA